MVANSSHTFIKSLIDRVQISTVSRRLVNNDIDNYQQWLQVIYPTAVTGGFCSFFRSHVTYSRAVNARAPGTSSSGRCRSTERMT